MIKAPPTPKGFRDILPELAKKRRDVINKIVGVLVEEEFGFVPVETPTIEFADTLKGKYGEEEKLIYEFEDRGGRKLALRYDLTVPLARFVASNLNLIQKGPFRRYQIGQVFRGENPQKGRWREFTQLDFDVVGSNDLQEDTKVIAAALKASQALGLNATMLINDRDIFSYFENSMSLSKKQITLIIRSVDKLKKIGREGVIKLLTEEGVKNAVDIVDSFANLKPTETILEVFQLLKKQGINEETMQFMPSLARGLDYYTGLIFELLPSKKITDLSIGGGGRYDNLVGAFAKRKIPAVGFSFGIDRLISILPDKTK